MARKGQHHRKQIRRKNALERLQKLIKKYTAEKSPKLNDSIQLAANIQKKLG